MTQPHPTPTSHGNWRVIDGKLVNEDEQPAAPVVPISNEAPATTSPTAANPRKNSTRT